MTATDELRRMLDERGVKHYDGVECTYWGDTVLARRDGSCPIYRFSATEVANGVSVHLLRVSPEQAIEATLGPRVQPPTMPEQPPYDLLIDLLHDEWDIDVMWDWLRRFWCVGLTDEGVRKRDEREATLGRGTCHPIISDNLNESEGMGDAWANCSECGYLLCVLTDPSSQMPNFCPNCGRKVINS